MQNQHRSLEAWIEGREVSRMAIRASRLHWSPPGSAVLQQLQRSALSIQLNIAEGYALGGKRFGNHLSMAYGSAIETGDLLELAAEEGLLPEEFAREALSHCRRAERLLVGLLKKHRPIVRTTGDGRRQTGPTP